MRALRDLLDELRAERRDVVRLPARHDALVDHDLLVDPPGAGIDEVGLDRRHDVTVLPFTMPASMSLHERLDLAPGKTSAS